MMILSKNKMIRKVFFENFWMQILFSMKDVR